MPTEAPPKLLVVVDTEEEFDWDGPFRRTSTSVASMRGVQAFQAICDEHEVQPQYMVTYPVATQPEGFAPLRQLHDEGRAGIGAHQHPWVCPPFDEPVDAFHSYPGNLPPALERAKLETLTAAIRDTFGFTPRMYKAGRYGFGFHTAQILEDLGYDIDLSPAGPFDHSGDGGPNDSEMPTTPFRFGRQRDLCCFPTTGGYVGRLPHRLLGRAYSLSRSPLVSWTKLPGLLARTHVVERVRLSPEGYTLGEMIRLTRALAGRGERVMTMTLHTPSLVPGNTPHVRTDRDLGLFLDRIRDYFTFFFDTYYGDASTPADVAPSVLSSSTPLRP